MTYPLERVVTTGWKFGIQKRNLENVVEQLRAACERRREILCAERLDNSYSTTYTTNDDSGNYSVTVSGGDSRPFIDNAHTREDGGFRASLKEIISEFIETLSFKLVLSN